MDFDGSPKRQVRILFNLENPQLPTTFLLELVGVDDQFLLASSASSYSCIAHFHLGCDKACVTDVGSVASRLGIDWDHAHVIIGWILWDFSRGRSFCYWISGGKWWVSCANIESFMFSFLC